MVTTFSVFRAVCIVKPYILLNLLISVIISVSSPVTVFSFPRSKTMILTCISDFLPNKQQNNGCVFFFFLVIDTTLVNAMMN